MELKRQKHINYCIKWSINSITNSCNLCLSEKLVICNFRDKDRLINKRMDLVSKCLHENNFILSNYKTNVSFVIVISIFILVIMNYLALKVCECIK